MFGIVVAAQSSVVKWAVVAGLVVGGLTLAPIAGRLVRKGLDSSKRSERQRLLAEPAARFLTTIILSASLIAALGVLSPSSLKPFPTKIVEFIPRLLIAVLFLLIGSTVSTLVANAVGSALGRATGTVNTAIVRAVRGIVVGLVTILAISQLGINTAVVDTLTQAAIFAAAATIALLTVLGGKSISAEIAAGQYVRRIVKVGDHVSSSLGSGTVRAVHGATLELDPGDGSALHIPHAALLNAALSVAAATEPQA